MEIDFKRKSAQELSHLNFRRNNDLHYCSNTQSIAEPQDPVSVFLALPIDKIYYSRINHLQKELSLDLAHLPHAVRWTRSHRLHLTLFFLGQHSYKDIDRLVHCMKQMNLSTGSEKMVLHCNQIQLFPESKPTVVALTGNASSSLLSLRQQVSNCLEKACIAPDFSHEKLGFLPHVTVGRVEEATDLKTQPIDIDFVFNQLILFKSEPLDPPRSPYVTHTALYKHMLTDCEL